MRDSRLEKNKIGCLMYKDEKKKKYDVKKIFLKFTYQNTKF